MRNAGPLIAMAALIFVVACTREAPPQKVDAGEARGNDSVKGPRDQTPVAQAGAAAAEPMYLDFGRELLLSVIKSSNSALGIYSWQGSCIEHEPAIQVLEDGVFSIQYVQGCAVYQKENVGQHMWRIEQEYLRASAKLEDPPPLKIQAFTRNGTYIFSAISDTNVHRKIRGSEYDVNKWIMRIASKKKRFKPLPEEISYLTRLKAPELPSTPPVGLDLQEELQPLLEDLECVEEISALKFERGSLQIAYREGCGNYTELSTRLTMFDMVARILNLAREHGFLPGVSFSARTVNGGYHFKQSASPTIVGAIGNRELGVIDWVEQRYTR